MSIDDLLGAAAYGGSGWRPRNQPLRNELGTIWQACGISNEWSPLRSVLLHRPGSEMETDGDPDQIQMLDRIDLALAQQQHDQIAQAYRGAGVQVHYVDPVSIPPPNMMYVADLMLSTPEGVVLGRPASQVRAGEERFVAQRLAQLEIPLLKYIRGYGVFEGADAMWVNSKQLLIATGLRTNSDGAQQVADLAADMGVDSTLVELPIGSMHLMGLLRIVDHDLAVSWPGMVPPAAVQLLSQSGFQVIYLPSEDINLRVALNFVTLGPRQVLMASGYPRAQQLLEEHGVECVTVNVSELVKAAGGIACLTGVLHRH